MNGLKPFRNIPRDILEWTKWMQNQDVVANTDISITESQVSDLGSYVTTTVIRSGNGTPEAVVMGSIGDLYRNLDGGASTTLYVKESGEGTMTGWVAK